MDDIRYIDRTVEGEPFKSNNLLKREWNPDAKYSDNAYCYAYFRTECALYNWGKGWTSFPEARDTFDNAMSDLLRSLGIPEKDRSIGANYDEALYTHPSGLSGVVKKNRVKEIAEALTKCEIVKLRWVDIYQNVSPMTDAEYLDFLQGKREEIEVELLRVFTTKRKNLYFSAGWREKVIDTGLPYHIPRREEVFANGSDGVLRNEWMKSVFQSLVDAGKIVSAPTKHGTGYRTAKPDELAA